MLRSHDDPGELHRIASEGLLGNVVALSSGPHLGAGRGQFSGLWTRDFCFAAGGLLHLGRGDVVGNHLSTLLAKQRSSDGLVPRLMDSLSPAYLRVAWHCCGRFLPPPMRARPLGNALLAEYRSEHGVEAVDSNLLVLATALSYVEQTSDHAWWRRHERRLVRAYRYYDRLRDGDLLVQPPYSDWQDSARRSGKTFYTNVLYHFVSARLGVSAAFGIDGGRPGRIRDRIRDAFFEPGTGLYRSVHGHPHLSLDGILLALDAELFDAATASALYAALKHHSLWQRHSIPGWCTTPDYPIQWISIPTKLVGLRHYHDRLRWSWLIALSAKVAAKMNDLTEARRILTLLQAWVVRDAAVYEVYSPEPPFEPWRSRLYASERHFSWGAGMIVEALAQLSRGVTRRTM